MELNIWKGSLCFNVCDRGVWCFPLSNTYQMTILVSTLIQSKAKVGEKFCITIAVKIPSSPPDKKRACKCWSEFEVWCVILQFADLHRHHSSIEKTTHVIGDICIMCSCICHIPVTSIVLLDYINLIMCHLWSLSKTCGGHESLSVHA